MLYAWEYLLFLTSIDGRIWKAILYEGILLCLLENTEGYHPGHINILLYVCPYHLMF